MCDVLVYGSFDGYPTSGFVTLNIVFATNGKAPSGAVWTGRRNIYYRGSLIDIAPQLPPQYAND